VLGEPCGGAPVQRGYFRGQRAAQFQPEQIGEQVVVAEPGALGVERFDERVRIFQRQQDLFRARAAGQQIGQLANLGSAALSSTRRRDPIPSGVVPVRRITGIR